MVSSLPLWSPALVPKLLVSFSLFFQIHPLFPLVLVLLSFPRHASLSREAHSSPGRVSAGGEARTPRSLSEVSVPAGPPLFLGSGLVQQAVETAVKLTDAAYARTTER